MKPTTTSILYGVKSDLEAIRRKMDTYMYGGEKPLEIKDLVHCRRVYERICRILDFLRLCGIDKTIEL